MQYLISDADSPTFETLGAHVRELHERMMVMAPGIDRVACALYDQADDVVKTLERIIPDEHFHMHIGRTLVDKYAVENDVHNEPIE